MYYFNNNIYYTFSVESVLYYNENYEMYFTSTLFYR